ncbi:hypothetical protein FSARC_12242 [Fusarium sarcochroum]|uniref:Zn(2)-C6 fungal-type domain-containing protein n=1 Tax=Fusarium sarcochroum TaxID=1208366 RepID=A0A8H4T9Y9_9HYPO|nr:hypothetical protein FSARC_12242 [Fusarium sarcochroum]
MLSSRRKSCKACVRSKRRCDLGLPDCGRCLARGVGCEYPWAALNNGHDSEQVIPYQDFSWVNETTSDEINNMTYSIDATPSISSPLSPVMSALLGDIISSRANLSPFNLDFTIATPTANGSSHLIQGTDDEGGPIATGSMFQARTEYGGRRIAAQALTLAQNGQTSFIHHTQAGASAVLQDALAACALHAMTNPANVHIIRSEIARRAALLIEAVEKVLAHSSTVELDLLPPVQALLIYQCIRLFSIRDITQQAQAERDLVHLSSWSTKLRQKILPFGGTDDWMNWIRHESIRRTVLFVEVLAGVYKFLKLGWDSAEGKVAHLGFTAQAALWEAKSAAEWKRVWSKSPRLELVVSTFSRDTEHAIPNDFEELGMLIRATFTGLEAFEEWLGGDKETLKKWGLREERVPPAY